MWKAATQRAAATLTRTHTITHTLLYQHTHKRSLLMYTHQYTDVEIG